MPHNLILFYFRWKVRPVGSLNKRPGRRSKNRFLFGRLTQIAGIWQKISTGGSVNVSNKSANVSVLLGPLQLNIIAY